MLTWCLRREPLGAGVSVLDLCAGSGVLAIAAALRGARATAIDVSRRAALSVALNAQLNGLEVEVMRGDLFAPVAGRRFNLIVSNPPYVPSVTDELPSGGLARSWEAGTSGRVFIDRICRKAVDYLHPGGALLLVHSTVCGEAETIDALVRTGLSTEIVWRHHGRLGPLMAARADRLRRQGRLREGDHEDVVVVRAARPASP